MDNHEIRGVRVRVELSRGGGRKGIPLSFNYFPHISWRSKQQPLVAIPALPAEEVATGPAIARESPPIVLPKATVGLPP